MEKNDIQDWFYRMLKIANSRYKYCLWAAFSSPVDSSQQKIYMNQRNYWAGLAKRIAQWSQEC